MAKGRKKSVSKETVRRAPQKIKKKTNKVKSAAVVQLTDPWEGYDPVVLQRALRLRWQSKAPTDFAMTEMPLKYRAADVRDSRLFMEKIAGTRKKKGPWPTTALDCGAGIGRITAGVLLRCKSLRKIDLLEPASQLRRQAREVFAGNPRVQRFFASPLEQFTPQRRYDVVWINWVLMYVSDTTAVAFLHRCRLRLPEDGIVIIKENVELRRVEEELDEEEFCTARTLKHYEKLFHNAGFAVLQKERQRDWPTEKGAFPLMMWALVPLVRTPHLR